jgi:site-specific DNA-methyltransferase (adenine-specific)
MSTRKIAVYEDDTRVWGVVEGDALMMLAKLPDHCVHAVVTDPPYGIDFGAHAWDGRDIRRSVSGEVCNAGEAFARWTQAWATQVARVLVPGGHLVAFGAPRTFHRLAVGVEDAGLEVRDQLLWLYGQGVPKSRHYPGGLGTTLKPGYEPILLARRPLETTTTTANIERWGAGALNIEAARVGPERYWPANLALSHQAGCTEKGCTENCPATQLDAANPRTSPSRLFYCAKATRIEREAGCQQLPRRQATLYNGRAPRVVANVHPTVKPLALMRWLIRLTVPTGGLVLDPFTGSGSTGIAAILEDRPFVGIERDSEYVDVACARLTHWAHEAQAA